MKRLAIAVFVVLAVPGSGQLAWDGIPFSTRLEAATLLLLILAITNHATREWVRKALERRTWRGAVIPTLLLVALIKLVTFVWYPFSDGFDACYRSVYAPIATENACEKSYEGPFLRRSDIGRSNTSRTDRVVDFGVGIHDWSLPFVNEYPRLGALWLLRLPFTAEYGAMIRNNEKERQYLPIYGNGEVSGSLGDTTFSDEPIAKSDRYEFPRVRLVEVPRGSSEFVLGYRYSDDDSAEIPDEAPPLRGPYAQLKVGDLQSRDQLLDLLSLRVRGFTLDLARSTTPDRVVVIDGRGNEVTRGEMSERPDVADFFKMPELDTSGFTISIPARAFIDGALTVRAVYDSRNVTLGSLSPAGGFVPDLPLVKTINSETQPAAFSVWWDVNRSELPALAPDQRHQLTLTLRALLALVDLISAFLVLGMAALLVSHLRREIVMASGLGLATFGLVHLGSSLAPVIAGSRLFLPYLAMAALIALVGRLPLRSPLITLVPSSAVLGYHMVFAHLGRYHEDVVNRWWGRLFFFGRDSDWYATHGFARHIFTTGSLWGGESVFWFQAGPRYLAFATRFLVGEHDVLLGILLTSIGFFGVLVLFTRFLRLHLDIVATSVGVMLLTATLTLMSEEYIAIFGFLGSSEYPTWAALFLVAGFVLATRTEDRSWLLVGTSLALGYVIQLRPNQIGGVFLLFVVLLVLVDRQDTSRTLSTIGRMTFGFITVVSLSLLHNLYYGESFVPFTANAGINYAFSWRDVLGLDVGDGTWGSVWQQWRTMMYWHEARNHTWALGFWGSQIAWLFAIGYRTKLNVALRARSLLLLIPFGYALPMLKYQMGSYYPRHLVVINLSFMCAALMAWPRNDEFVERNIDAEPAAEKLPGSDDWTPIAAPAPEPIVSAVSR